MNFLDPTHWLLLAIIAVLAVANALLLRRQRKQDAPLMRTANSSLVNRQAAQALHAANKQAHKQPSTEPRPRVRAIGADLPPSYPPRKDAAPVGDRRATRH